MGKSAKENCGVWIADFGLKRQIRKIAAYSRSLVSISPLKKRHFGNPNSEISNQYYSYYGIFVFNPQSTFRNLQFLLHSMVFADNRPVPAGLAAVPVLRRLDLVETIKLTDVLKAFVNELPGALTLGIDFAPFLG